jgi:UDP-N-acetylglucosamine:LPS N-acetylglucosamine transferase
VLVGAGAAVRTSRLDDLPEIIEHVLKDRAAREEMIAAARRLGRPNAADDAASLIARLVQIRKDVVA